MDTPCSIPRKKSRWEPVVIPISLVSEGCGRIAENISELTDHAIRFLDLSEEVVSRRIAQILVIHAMDEAGKLLEIIRKTIEAKHTEAVSISIDGFYSHSRKGSQAGSIGVLTIDWLQSVIEKLAVSDIKEPIIQGSYRIHLESLKESFCREREGALYVDFDEGRWLSPTVQDVSYIALDASLLGILAAITLDTVNAGLPIHHLDKLAKQISDPATIEELVRRIKETVAGEKRPLC